MKRFYYLATLMLVISLSFLACKKTDYTVPPIQAHFTDTIGAYFIKPTSASFNVPIGLTTPTNVDRTVTVSVESPSGATAGVDYTIPSTTVTIPAGQVLGNLVINGNFPAYSSGKVDTLIFTITSSDVPVSFNNRYTVTLQRYCDFNIGDFIGDYANTTDTYAGGPFNSAAYTTTVTAIDSLSPTSANFTIENIGDAGWAPILFTLDWSNPAAFKATLLQQAGIGDAGTISTTYTGKDISVRPFAGQPGTFSSCESTITLRLQLGVTGVGWFGGLYEVKMAR